MGARSPEERAVSPLHVLAGLLALGLFGYLLFALLKAERF
jgi:K+-transporting ATPase KdpF subunit